MSNSTIEIKLFDGFSISREGEEILTNLAGTRKTKLFVSYLLVNRNRAIPHKELFELLWSGEDYANPGTALRTLLYRFRSMLEKEGAEQLENAVISKRGTYQWNKNLDISIDVLEFEEMANEGLNLTVNKSRRKECLDKAYELYKGSLLPDFKSEPWMISKASYYRELYTKVVEEYISILKEDGEYLRIVEVAGRAISLIGSSELIELEAEVAKLHLVNKTASDSSIEDYYTNVRELTMNLEDDSVKIQAELEDDTVEQRAFVCDYPTFKEIYRLQRRMQARTKATIFLGLVDMRMNTDGIDSDGIEKYYNDIVECCSLQLRCGDAICKQKDTQISILFPADSYEDAVRVMERLKRASISRTCEDVVFVYKLKTLKNAKE